MEHECKKATRKPALAAKNSDATNLTRHFIGGSYSLGGGMTPLNNLFGKFSHELTKYMLLIIQQKSFDFLPLITQLMLI